ncbi:hypothetical protein [Rhodovulum sp. PH10]|uniref:hypothetical protein n=1 Tax=Rhodovulum sp. PH10 TaxID=1187851 RepID=UPI00058F79C2|nr:hypothetical protein [Rhodovulum sp. PH10]
MSKSHPTLGAAAAPEDPEDLHYGRIGIAAVAAAIDCQHLPPPKSDVKTFVDDEECWGGDLTYAA